MKESRSVTVLANDTDVHFEQGLETPVLMEFSIKEKTVTDIPATIKETPKYHPSNVTSSD